LLLLLVLAQLLHTVAADVPAAYAAVSKKPQNSAGTPAVVTAAAAADRQCNSHRSSLKCSTFMQSLLKQCLTSTTFVHEMH
jgi:hypothetical protein